MNDAQAASSCAAIASLRVSERMNRSNAACSGSFASEVQIASSPAMTRVGSSLYTGITSAMRLLTASPSASDARMTRRSRPSSRMRKPAIAVQNAPDIQVKSAKNSTTLAASSGESPFVLRMSSNRNVAKPLVANVSPKNAARRRRRARPSRPDTVMAQSLRRRKLIDPCLAQRLAIECQIAFDVDRLLRFRRHDPKGHAPVARLGDLLDDDAVYGAAVRRDVRFHRLCSVEAVEIPSRVVDHHLLRAV